VYVNHVSSVTFYHLSNRYTQKRHSNQWGEKPQNLSLGTRGPHQMGSSI